MKHNGGKLTAARKSPRVSKEDLLKSQADAQERATRLAWFIRTLAPAEGFSFLASPRGLQELLVEVVDENVHFYDITDPSERDRLTAELWRLHQDGPHLTSLLEALEDARDYRAKWRTGTL